MSNAFLGTKNIGEIKGKFIIPDYQRGYRWGDLEVVRLLEDVYENGSEGYCLQPIVVKRQGDDFILIDGQQRLTTVYLLYQYFHKASNGFMPAPRFTLQYITRPKSQAFLENIDLSLREDNIDFWYMANAYEKIEKWFESQDKKESVMTLINQFFDGQSGNVRVIWYEVDEREDDNKLFQRLNIGKIPLTSAELVKAIFLSASANLQEERQNEIALQWDFIERELHDESFWCFLTNDSTDGYPTRIDLILNLIAGKDAKCRETYFTFFQFAKMRETQPLTDVWTKEIYRTFLLLRDWYEQSEFYHKIGYLIACGEISLADAYKAYKGIVKSQFKVFLDGKIKKSVQFSKPYGALTYENDKKSIHKLLLLFNVKTVENSGGRFPFERYKLKEKGVRWSLEHIHAQHSLGLKTEAEWRKWLELHRSAVEALGDNPLLEEIDALLAKKEIGRGAFEDLSVRIVDALSARDTLQVDGLGNLALLDTSSNAALNNSTFFVKRAHIIEMDRAGRFIPICTKNVFLKYYSQRDVQPYFWSRKDSEAYVEEMNRTLYEYCGGKINLEMPEGDD